jgi:predicted RNA-binding Zn-ribbon protein involved in translation (DUF1610 family)
MSESEFAAAPGPSSSPAGSDPAGFEPTLVVSSRDLAEGRLRRESELCVHACKSCNVELADRYHFDCPECGHPEPPVSRCRTCGGEVSPERVKYVAHGRARGSVTKLVPGISCRACGLSAVEELGLDALGELANLARGPLVILPECGFATPDLIEVLADADVCGADEPEEVEKERDGMRLRVGSPSALFDAALPAISQHDPADIFSPTLSLEPGPPYTLAQRRTAALLLAELQRELGAPVTCWSASVGLSEEPLVDPVLTQQLMQLPGDPGAVGLGLYHALVAGHAPGRFLNSVRLLTFVLRPDPEEVWAAALERRVSALEPLPLDILQQLWLAMHPGQPFELGRVYGSMQAFNARYTAPLEPERGAPLPWEEPDFEGYAAWLRRLVSALLTPELDAGLARAHN